MADLHRADDLADPRAVDAAEPERDRVLAVEDRGQRRVVRVGRLGDGRPAVGQELRLGLPQPIAVGRAQLDRWSNRRPSPPPCGSAGRRCTPRRRGGRPSRRRSLVPARRPTIASFGVRFPHDGPRSKLFGQPGKSVSGRSRRSGPIPVNSTTPGDSGSLAGTTEVGAVVVASVVLGATVVVGVSSEPVVGAAAAVEVTSSTTTWSRSSGQATAATTPAAIAAATPIHTPVATRRRPFITGARACSVSTSAAASRAIVRRRVAHAVVGRAHWSLLAPSATPSAWRPRCRCTRAVDSLHPRMSAISAVVRSST